MAKIKSVFFGVITALLVLLSPNLLAQNKSDHFIDDKGYIGLAYLTKSSTPSWGFMGGWTRYYSKYRVSFLVEGSLDLHFDSNTTESSSRYYTDTFSNGQSRCRDRETGRFVSSSLCNDSTEYTTDVSARLSGLVNYHLPLSEQVDFTVGAGYLISNVSTPILSIGLRPSPRNSGLSGSLGFGKNYLYLGVVYLF